MHPNTYHALRKAGLKPAFSDVPAHSSELLTPDETAKLLRLARQTLARWRVEGAGPAFIKIGSRVVYRSADVEAWLAGRRVHPTRQSSEAA